MPTQLHALTGLPTRVELDQELKQAIKQRESCALALLDMDGLVEVNAELGNEAGDRVLKALAELMQQSAVGAVYHIGGDEFALMVKGTTLEQA
ncbi:MAG: GGDEF domain-containing protein, partial [Chloroflexales bacterium]|nr:GGDEF domain-containing protein [Chloroflexales bacterium]